MLFDCYIYLYIILRNKKKKEKNGEKSYYQRDPNQSHCLVGYQSFVRCLCPWFLFSCTVKQMNLSRFFLLEILMMVHKKLATNFGFDFLDLHLDRMDPLLHLDRAANLNQLLIMNQFLHPTFGNGLKNGPFNGM